MGKKNLFNFYLDDDDKQAAIDKLNRLVGDTSKGKLAAMMRVCIKAFVMTPDDKIKKDFIEAVQGEYTYNQDKTKRSKL